jgi:hypothetical protein
MVQRLIQGGGPTIDDGILVKMFESIFIEGMCLFTTITYRLELPIVQLDCQIIAAQSATRTGNVVQGLFDFIVPHVLSMILCAAAGRV